MRDHHLAVRCTCGAGRVIAVGQMARDRRLADRTLAHVALRFRQGSRQAPWPMRTGLAIAPALRGGADWDGVHWVRVEGDNGAARAHRPGLPALSLPGL